MHTTQKEEGGQSGDYIHDLKLNQGSQEVGKQWGDLGIKFVNLGECLHA